MIERSLRAGAYLGSALVGAIVGVLIWGADPGPTPTVLATAVVAVMVALITAVTTDRRQERQLAHERETTREELRAGVERFSRRVAHERIMEDLAELRTVLDEAASRLAEGEVADSNYVSTYNWLRKHKWPTLHDGEVPASEVEDLLEAMASRREAVHRALAAGERLAMRLGYKSNVYRHYSRAAHTLLGYLDLDDSDEGEERSKLNAELVKHRSAFVEAAEELIATASEIRHP